MPIIDIRAHGGVFKGGNGMQTVLTVPAQLDTGQSASAGDGVTLNTNGKAQKAGKISYSDSGLFTLTSGGNVCSYDIYKIDEQRILVVYGFTNINNLYAFVLTTKEDGTAPTKGQEVTIPYNSYPIYGDRNIKISEVGNSRYMIVCTYNDNKTVFGLINVNGTSITVVRNDFIFDDTISANHGLISHGNRIWFIYRSLAANPNTLMIVSFIVSGNTITQGSKYTIGTDGNGPEPRDFFVINPNSNLCLLGWRAGSYYYVYSFQIYPTTGGIGTIRTMFYDSSASGSVSSLFSLSTNYFCAIYDKNSSYDVVFRMGYVSNDGVVGTVGGPYTYDNDRNIMDAPFGIGLSENYFVGIHPQNQSNANSNLHARTFDFPTGTAPTRTSIVDLESALPFGKSFVHIKAIKFFKNRIAVFAINQNTTSIVFRTFWVTEDTKAATKTLNFLQTIVGIAKTPGTAGLSITLQANGILKGVLTGLTPATRYYWDFVNKTITTTSGIDAKEIGYAIASDEIILNLDNYSNVTSFEDVKRSFSGTATVGNVVTLSNGGVISNYIGGATPLGIYQGNGVVLLKGKSKVHTGLIAGMKYYLSTITGMLTYLNEGPFIGVALDSSTLLIPDFLV